MSFMQLHRVLVGSAVLFCLSSCRSQDDYRKERADFAVKHLEIVSLKETPKSKVFSLPECIRWSLANNLDLKVYDLEQSIARENRTAEMLGMLPELNVANTLTARNNQAASGSQQVAASGLTYGASTSTDDTVNVFNIDLALSTLDFGLAYFNTMQANDRMLLRDQETIRARQNLALDVARTYFKVAAAQRSIMITRSLLDRCRNRSAMIEELGRTRKISPFRMFDEHKRFVELEKRLTSYIRTYDSACVELRALMGCLPNLEIKVDDSCLNKLPDFYVPAVEDMEMIALLQRPELMQIDIQRHVAIIENRKTVLMMFPNVRAFADFTNSNNSFLYNSSWWEVGIRATYNLLKLPQQISRYRAIDGQIDAAEQRACALAVGVMSQVRIAMFSMNEAKERMTINKRVFDTYTQNRNFAKANMQDTGSLSQLELDRIELETAETEINYLISLGECFTSYYRILNTVGIENLDKKSVAEASADLTQARSRMAGELEELKKKAAAEQPAVTPKAEPAKVTTPAPKAEPAKPVVNTSAK